MGTVVVFHHAHGLTEGVAEFVDQLRASGHEVLAPDLFDGQTFDSIEEGLAYVEDMGFEGFIERGVHAADAVGDDAVFIGFSLGVLPAQMLAQTRSATVGAILCYSCVPVSEFGDSWPTDVPLQIHAMDGDPFFVGEGDIEAARAIVASDADADLFLYRGDEHLFADSSLPSYEPDAAALLIRRILAFLDGLPKPEDRT